MLENIKSSHIFQKVFTYINEKMKLKLVKYNKRISNKLYIGLINYQTFQSKYIVYEENEKGKEYNIFTNELIFEGNYKNKIKNGHGKEYYYDELIFEGEFLNGKKNGKGKEYYDNGELKFDGEYLNGKRWNGKGYDVNNNLI